MTDRNEIIREIEELLGSEGSDELATKMFAVLLRERLVTFDAQQGFELQEDIDEQRWLKLLVEADAA